jgi:hypothetical protein
MQSEEVNAVPEPGVSKDHERGTDASLGGAGEGVKNLTKSVYLWLVLSQNSTPCGIVKIDPG